MAEIAEITPSRALKSADLDLVDAASPGERCRLPGLAMLKVDEVLYGTAKSAMTGPARMPAKKGLAGG